MRFCSVAGFSGGTGGGGNAKANAGQRHSAHASRNNFTS